MSPLLSSLIAASALGIACSLLSVFVVTKRWAFIGEGIAHAGFGGAGTAWILSLLFPSLAFLASETTLYAISILFCFAVAFLVALFTRQSEARQSRATVDTVVGIFLVASLAWGFMAYGIYAHKTNSFPPQFGDYLGFERLKALSSTFVVTAVAISAFVVFAVSSFWKELLFYTTDEHQAQASGVNTRLIHFGLIFLITLVIIIGMRLMGTVLIVALLVLPAATALQLARTTRQTLTLSLATGLLASISGPTLTHLLPFLPEGPVIVLTLFTLFLASLLISATRPR